MKITYKNPKYIKYSNGAEKIVGEETYYLTDTGREIPKNSIRVISEEQYTILNLNRKLKEVKNAMVKNHDNRKIELDDFFYLQREKFRLKESIEKMRNKK